MSSDNLGTLTQSFADCSWTSQFAERARQTHVPDYRTCERVMDYSGACAIRHSYQLQELFRAGAGGTLTDCGHGCALWTVGEAFPTGPCQQSLTGTMEVLKPEAIQSAQLEEVWYEDYIAGLWIDGVNHYADTAGQCENSDSPTVWLGHDLTGYFKTAGVKSVRLDLIQGGDLGGGTAKIRIRYDPRQAVVADTWEDNPECLRLVQAIGDGACTGPIACAAMPATVNGCLPITGGSVCPEDLLALPRGGDLQSLSAHHRERGLHRLLRGADGLLDRSPGAAPVSLQRRGCPHRLPGAGAGSPAAGSCAAPA